MASDMFNGVRRGIKSYPPTGSSVCWLRVMELCGSVQRKVLQVGKTASSPSTRNSLDVIFSSSWRIVRDRFGLAEGQFQLESSVRFGIAAFNALETTAVSAALYSTYTKT